MLKSLKIGKKTINEKRTLIVAEISANHAGSLSKAKKIILAAKKSGADAVKIQSYVPDSLTLNSNKKDFKINTNSGKAWLKYKNLYNLYKVGQTPIKWHKPLFKYCKQINIEIFSSPFDENMVDVLEKLKCPAYKIASPEINHFPLLKKVAQTGKPIIISTGVAFEEDISSAVNFIKKNGNKKICILKCDSNYPSNFLNSNLSSIKYLKKKFKTFVGFSDHTIGNETAIASTFFGASVIEKLFNINNNHSLDSFFSSSPEQFKDLVKAIRANEKDKNNKKYKISDMAKANRVSLRSIYISKNVKKNEIITNKNIRVVRPGYGLHPKFYDKIIGKRFKNKKNFGDCLKLSDIDF